MRTSTRCTAVLAASVLILACGTGDSSRKAQWSGTIDTLESGRVVVHNQDEAVTQETLPELLRIGGSEGDSPDVFGQIGALELGPEGMVYVLDGQASEIRVFAADGTHLRTFGRSGQGPGELSRPAGMATDDDGLIWVLNWGNARYSAFDPNTGQLVTERRRLPSYVEIPWRGRFDRSGHLLDVGLGRAGEVVAMRLDPAFVPRDTFQLPVVDDRQQVNFIRDGVRVMPALDPFTAMPSWSSHPDGGIVVGEGNMYRLHRISVDGDTTMTIELDRTKTPVSRAERDSALADFQQLLQRAGGATPDRQPRVASHKPAHGPLFVDDQSRIWVRRTSTDTAATWDIFDASGRLSGAVTIPLQPGFLPPVVRGDRLAVATMVDGIPAVVVFAFH